MSSPMTFYEGIKVRDTRPRRKRFSNLLMRYHRFLIYAAVERKEEATYWHNKDLTRLSCTKALSITCGQS